MPFLVHPEHGLRLKGRVNVAHHVNFKSMDATRKTHHEAIRAQQGKSFLATFSK
jgi:hypothetical protein